MELIGGFLRSDVMDCQNLMFSFHISLADALSSEQWF